MKAMIAALVLCSACVSESQIGPYVKSVNRNGSWLIVTKCMIMQEGDELAEGRCTMEQLPLGSVPMMPPPQQGYPQQPMPPPQPMPQSK
jgi:hypothetical protein